MAKTCSTCAAFNVLGGECRKNAPQGAVILGPGGQAQMVGFFPGTSAEKWCLQHIPSQEIEAAETLADLARTALLPA